MTIINPRLMAMLSPIMYSTGTVQKPTESQDARGQTVKEWTTLLGHAHLTCLINTTGGTETKATNQVYATATHEILISGYYPLITPKMRWVDDVTGAIYDILLVNHESFQTFTKLVVEVKH